MRVGIQPGDGYVARSGRAVLVVLGGGTDEVVTSLLDGFERICAAEPTPGRQLARWLATQLVQADPATVPPFGAAAPADSGWATVVHGPVVVRTEGPAGAQTISGRDAATWVDRIVDGGFTRMTITPEGSPDGAFDHRYRFTDGVVPGSGVAFGASTAEAVAGAAMAPMAGMTHAAVAADPMTEPMPVVEAVPVAAPAPDPEPAPMPAPPGVAGVSPAVVLPPAVEAEEPSPPPPAQTFTPIALFGQPAEAAAREPLPVLSEDDDDDPADAEDAAIVDGILCERNHFNHPFALYCQQCGVSTVHRTRTLVKGPRPSLGVFVADDGATYSIDADYLVGREPGNDPAVAAGELRPLMLTDNQRSVSRVHAEIRLHEWDVYVVDRGSANGTFIAPKDAHEWTRLTGTERIVPGTRVAFGRRVLTFDTHHQV